jgi:hypothetical protein
MPQTRRRAHARGSFVLFARWRALGLAAAGEAARQCVHCRAFGGLLVYHDFDAAVAGAPSAVLLSATGLDSP